MKKNIILLSLLLLSVFAFAQEAIKLNVTYKFSYVRDLENKEAPYTSNMVLSLGKTSSRYCTEKLFNDNDKKIIEARKKEQERLQSMPSSGMTAVVGGPTLTVGKYGVIINEEVLKNFSTKKLIIEAKLGIKNYHAETNLSEIAWTVLPETKKIGNYDCQKATGSYGGRKYEAWFTKDIPYQDGPWKLHGLPGLILEAKDTANEISFTFKEISKNDDTEETTQSFLNSPYSIDTNTKDLAKARKAFETDPKGVMSAQAPNARLYVRNIDNPNDKTVVKIKKYNPIEL
ncbi:MAG: GLPGLI family protein [Chitinophagaceae bacterium]|nr:GLPGLI family protein [Chitinophagaceae bacterium]